jgi:SRSO17 transposase
MNQLDRELSEYMASMVEGLGRSERRRALELYLTGLLLEGERKSIGSVEVIRTPREHVRGILSLAHDPWRGETAVRLSTTVGLPKQIEKRRAGLDIVAEPRLPAGGPRHS